MTEPRHLSRRERQIMDALYQAGQATVAEIRAAIPDAPSYSAVRTMLRILEEKGHVRHNLDGTRYVYIPTVTRDTLMWLAVGDCAFRVRPVDGLNGRWGIAGA